MQPGYSMASSICDLNEGRDLLGYQPRFPSMAVTKVPVFLIKSMSSRSRGLESDWRIR